MIETSTPAANPSSNDASKSTTSGSLDEGDNLFYEGIKKDLDMLFTEPKESTINNLLMYSRSKKKR